MRRLISWIIILPAAAIVVVFALNNRTGVAIDLWPFGIIVEMPVYLAFILVLGVGAILGGVASVLAGSKARGHYRASSYEAAVKRRELEKLNTKYENLEAAQNKSGQNKDEQNKGGQKREIISPTTN